MRRGIGEGLELGRMLLVLFGVWLTISPWMFGYADNLSAVQVTITGALVVLTTGASVLFGPVTALPLWFALVLGVWTMATPIMFGQFGRSFSANNEIVVGLLILLASAVAIGSRARMRLYAGGPDPQGAAGQTSLW
jgi:SPW repeat-containing protein